MQFLIEMLSIYLCFNSKQLYQIDTLIVHVFVMVISLCPVRVGGWWMGRWVNGGFFYVKNKLIITVCNLYFSIKSVKKRRKNCTIQV